MNRRAALLTALALPLALALPGPITAETVSYKASGVRGEVIDLAAMRGRWVAVNFWATWCKPCRKEIPDLSALHDERDDIEVIGLAFEEVEPAAILAFLEQYPATYPIALVDVYDPPAVFGMPMVLPTTMLISPSGENAKTFLGPVTREQIEAWVDGQGPGS